MTALKNSNVIVEVDDFDERDRTYQVSIYRIQRETSAYRARRYRVTEGSKFERWLVAILPEPIHDTIRWQQGKLVYNWNK